MNNKAKEKKRKKKRNAKELVPSQVSLL